MRWCEFIAAATIMAVSFATNAQSAKSANRFPVKIVVANSRFLEDGRQELEVLITPDEHVELYANPAGNDDALAAAAMQVRILAAERVIPAEVTYAKPDKISEHEDLAINFYTKPTTLRLLYKPPSDGKITIRCDVSGWHTQRSYCLGRGRIEMDFRPSN